ncbi:MAG: SDR family oxidoreductase [Lewinella sp.]
MNILVTGGAGFIGSNLVGALLEDERVDIVRVLDNLATGSIENLKDYQGNPAFEFLEGDITDYDACLKACEGIHRITHQAALGSVPRSIKNPLLTNAVNVGGTLNIFNAARECGLDRVVYAASSSTYGDSTELPKVEDRIGKPLSPYAVTKLVNELYADVFHQTYGTDFVGLRYFNVFGRKQSPDGAYAAVIPIFFSLALKGEGPVINGDGTFSRDFTYIDNVIQANKLALFSNSPEALNEVYNIGAGQRTTLNELWSRIRELTGTEVYAHYGPTRPGDVPHSLADITKARKLLGYDPAISVMDGLTLAADWYATNLTPAKA